MDRGYLDFERLYGLDQARGFFVTRAKRNLDARRLYSAPVNRDTGLICDHTIALNGFYAAKHYPGHLRRIRYRDPESGGARRRRRAGRSDRGRATTRRVEDGAMLRAATLWLRPA